MAVPTLPTAAVRRWARPWAQAPLRVLVLGVAALFLAALHIRRPATLCTLRATTGIPCPFCGGTTAAVRLGHGDPLGALAASPLALLLFTGFVAWPLRVYSALPARWEALGHRRQARVVLVAATVLLTFGEVWQLRRFGFW
jgi:hypothetical protein